MNEYQCRHNTINAIQLTGSIENLEEIISLLGNQFDEYYPEDFNNSGDHGELWFYETNNDVEMRNDTCIFVGDYLYKVTETHFIGISARLFDELFIKSR